MMREELALFLEESESLLIEKFRQGIIVTEWDSSAGFIYENDLTMLHLVIRYLREDIEMDQVKDLAYKVASERIQANINIADFVYNVCLGRRIVFEHIFVHFHNQFELGEALGRLSTCFDHFLVNAVSRYNELRNSDLEEKQLFIEQTHKDQLTILGQMSASFVHEFRNPLTSVMGFTKLLMQENPDLPYLDIMMNELEQLNYRVTQFLLVSKKGHTLKVEEMIKLDNLFEEILSFLYPQIVDVNVEILRQIDPEIWLFGYRDEIKQVFINILINAIDAVQRHNGYRLVLIKADREENSIHISIANNGQPIPGELIPVIFEPFVTTKDLGTGIGLYVCKQIIVRHEGTISCESEETQTTFSITFPVPRRDES